MRLDVLDADTLARVGWVDVWVSLYWDSPYYSEGSFTLEVRPTTENLQLLQEGRWLVRSDENPRIPMRICSRANQNEDANLVVSGYPATWLLTKRVSAVSIKNQNAEAAMRSLVSATKPWPRLALGTEYGFDTVFAKQTSGGTVFDYCQTIGQACDLGFRIVLDGSGDKASAHKYYQQVLRRLPQDAEVHYYYGRSLGEAGKVFDAYLHLAYSSLYQNDKRKTESWLKQARPLARTPVEQDQLKRFEAIYAERQEVWK